MQDESPFSSVFGAVETIRGAIGYIILLPITLAFLIVGNTTGRLIGVALLALGVFVAIRIFRANARATDQFGCLRQRARVKPDFPGLTVERGVICECPGVDPNAASA